MTAVPPEFAPRLLVVDDTADNVVLLERLLGRWGYEDVVSTTDSAAALALIEQTRPDLLLLDLQMPPPDGFEILAALAERDAGPVRVPVLVLTADITPETKRRALDAGARDFLSKPFDFDEVRLRVRNLLETRRLQLELATQNETLERRVRARTRHLEQARLESLQRLARAAEYRDDETLEHTERVGRTAALLGEVLGLPSQEVTALRHAAPLHDIGKVAISDAILLKQGDLSAVEFEMVRTHTTVGARILSGSGSDLLRMAEQIAVGHHERWDGNGYPSGAAGEAIPQAARITAVADVFDVLVHDRPYRTAMAVGEAVEAVLAMAGTAFDPAVVRAFAELDHPTLVTLGAP